MHAQAQAPDETLIVLLKHVHTLSRTVYCVDLIFIKPNKAATLLRLPSPSSIILPAPPIKNVDGAESGLANKYLIVKITPVPRRISPDRNEQIDLFFCKSHVDVPAEGWRRHRRPDAVFSEYTGGRDTDS